MEEPTACSEYDHKSTHQTLIKRHSAALNAEMIREMYTIVMPGKVSNTEPLCRVTTLTYIVYTYDPLQSYQFVL